MLDPHRKGKAHERLESEELLEPSCHKKPQVDDEEMLDDTPRACSSRNLQAVPGPQGSSGFSNRVVCMESGY